MNLRSGKIKDNNLHIPRRQRTKTMTNTTNQDRGQNPPQGASTIISSSIDASSTIPVGSSNTVPVSTLEIPTAPHSGSQLYSTPTRPPGFEPFRPRNPPYGMPTSFMAGLHNASTSSPVQGSGSRMNHLGTNSQNLGNYTQLPTLTTNNQAALRQQMDDSNHDMVGVLAREMNDIFGPLIQNINRTNQENAVQMSRIADFFGAPDAPMRRRQNPVVIRNEEPTIE